MNRVERRYKELMVADWPKTALAESLAKAEAENQKLREALRGLRLTTDCWCLLDDHDYACKAAQFALADQQQKEQG